MKLGSFTLILIASFSVPCHAQMRIWTDKASGREVQAEFVEMSDGMVTVRTPDGGLARVSVEQLSEADQEYLRAQNAPADTPSLPQPESVEPDSAKPADGVKPRTWTQRSTGQQVEGTFIELADEFVVVQRLDGHGARVPFQSLSDEDQQYVKSMLARQKPPDGAHAADSDALVHSGSEAPGPTASDNEALGEPAPSADLSAPDTGDLRQSWLPGSSVETLLLERVPNWLESQAQTARQRPLRYYLLSGWLAVALATSGIARGLKRSFFLWFGAGAVLPVLSLARLLMVGRRRDGEADWKTVLALLLSVVLIGSALAFAGFLAIMAERGGEALWQYAESPGSYGALGVWAGFALLAAVAARLLGRSAVAWFLLAALFPPLAALCLALLPPRRSIDQMRRSARGSAALPEKRKKLRGPCPVRIENPNERAVSVGLRSSQGGVDFRVPAQGHAEAHVPAGRYETYFVYSDDPDSLYQGDTVTAVRDRVVVITMTPVPHGNFGIRKVN